MKARAHGFSLIELIVAIVIISAVGTTVLALVARVSLTSTDAMAQSQRTAIAKSYLDEILSKSQAVHEAVVFHPELAMALVLLRIDHGEVLAHAQPDAELLDAGFEHARPADQDRMRDLLFHDDLHCA